MNCLFNLCFSCITKENYWAEYPIGLFKTKEDVNAVINALTKDGGRFSNIDCKTRISKIEVIGENTDYDRVYRFYGQNIDSSDEDIVESPCYIDKSAAIQELIKAKAITPRQQWNLETHIIGKTTYDLSNALSK